MRDNTRQNFAHLMQQVMTKLRGMLGEQTLSLEDYTGPDPADLFSSEDGGTRLMILACLSAVGEADFTFVTHISREASEEERLRSLAWLKEQGCVTDRHCWERRGFLLRRVELIFYSATPTGRMLYAKTEALLPENASKVSSTVLIHSGRDEFLAWIVIAGGTVVLMIVGVLSHLH